MKRLLLFATLSATAATTILTERPPATDSKKMRTAIIFRDAAPADTAEDAPLKAEIRRNFTPGEDPLPQGWHLLTRKELTSGDRRITKMLEDLAGERLADLQKPNAFTENISKDICTILVLLGRSSDPNTLAFLREYAKIPERGICRLAVKAYLDIQEGGGDSAEFIREIISKNTDIRSYCYTNLGEAIGTLKEKNRTDDMEKLYALMLDMAQTEQDSRNARIFDIILCETFDGYAQSVQREQAIQKFLTSTDSWARDHYAKIKAELDKIPAEKRTDLSTRFTLAPLPMEKTNN